MDIFPSTITQEIEPFQHPITLNKLRDLCSKFEIQPAICYLDRNGKIYFKPKDWNNNMQTHFIAIGKTSYTKLINLKTAPWSLVEQRLQKYTNTEKMNIDVRTCFVFENHYLVKRFFTFGFRTVQKNSFHIFTATTVPLALYVLNSNIKRKERSFKSSDQCHFKLYRLKQNTTWYIKENTSYLIIAVQKTLFSAYIMRQLPKFSKSYKLAPTWREKEEEFKPPQTPRLDRINMAKHLKGLMNVQTENTEIVNTESSENTENSENEMNVQTENTEIVNTENSENEMNIETENSENVKNTENSENVKNTENEMNVENEMNIENTSFVENVMNIQHSDNDATTSAVIPTNISNCDATTSAVIPIITINYPINNNLENTRTFIAKRVRTLFNQFYEGPPIPSNFKISNQKECHLLDLSKTNNQNEGCNLIIDNEELCKWLDSFSNEELCEWLDSFSNF